MGFWWHETFSFVADDLISHPTIKPTKTIILQHYL